MIRGLPLTIATGQRGETTALSLTSHTSHTSSGNMNDYISSLPRPGSGDRWRKMQRFTVLPLFPLSFSRVVHVLNLALEKQTNKDKDQLLSPVLQAVFMGCIILCESCEYRICNSFICDVSHNASLLAHVVFQIIMRITQYF